MTAFWAVPRMWDGETVVIVASGESLTLRDIRHIAMAKLQGRCRVVAVNDSIYPCWFADLHYACDPKWWRWHAQTALKSPAVRVTVAVNLPAEWDVMCLKETGKTGFDPDPKYLRTGGNGAYQAIHLATHAGAKKILLLGVDMQGEHWFGGHPDNVRPDYGSVMLPWFATLIEPLRERGVEVINCSPNSALECFPKAKLEEVLPA